MHDDRGQPADRRPTGAPEESPRPLPGGPAAESSRTARGPLADAWAFIALAGIIGLAMWFVGMAPAPGPSAPESAVPRVAASRPHSDPLPSWNDTATKKKILSFLDDVTRSGAPTFVPVEERVAVFDHDGTLVCEKPLVHGAFLIDQLRAFVARHPELAHEEPYATLLGGDLDFLRRLGKQFFADLTFQALAGVPEDRLEQAVREFIATARHPVFDVPYGDVTFQPMKELIALLRAKGFAIWICSGSGVHFMRPAAAAWYGIGPEHVIASRSTTELAEVDDGGPLPPDASPNRRLALVVQPRLEILNDEGRKPVSIGEHVGRRPIFAAGNVGTGGDVEMLRWSQSSPRPSLQLLVLHDDAAREMAYDEPTRESLDAADRYGWQVVKIASDWNRVFARPLEKHAPSPAANPAPGAAADVPPPSRWEAEVATYEELDRAQPPTPGGICLLGSSNIRLWTTLTADFPDLNVVNRGVGGARLAELTALAPRLLAAADPRAIVVSAGTNDVDAGATADAVRDAFAGLVTTLRQAAPDATIAFLAIAPSIKRWDQLERQRAANDAVRDFIATSGDARHRFLDANAALLGRDGTPDPACFLQDLQHPSVVGNARRAEILRPMFDDLLESAGR